jgi:hypothetical protein
MTSLFLQTQAVIKDITRIPDAVLSTILNDFLLPSIEEVKENFKKVIEEGDLDTNQEDGEDAIPGYLHSTKCGYIQPKWTGRRQPKFIKNQRILFEKTEHTYCKNLIKDGKCSNKYHCSTKTENVALKSEDYITYNILASTIEIMKQRLKMQEYKLFFFVENVRALRSEGNLSSEHTNVVDSQDDSD